MANLKPNEAGERHVGRAKAKFFHTRSATAIIDAAEFVGEECVINPDDPNTPRGITAFLAKVAREQPAIMCGMLARNSTTEAIRKSAQRS